MQQYNKAVVAFLMPWVMAGLGWLAAKTGIAFEDTYKDDVAAILGMAVSVSVGAAGVVWRVPNKE